MASRFPWRAVVALAAVAALGGAAAAVIAGGRPVPDGPVPVVWDREACAHCRMLVGEPAFAAQLVTTAGDVVNFDDPGCLIHYVDERAPAVHRMWFHDSAADRWLPATGVGFVAGATTPMGYGLAAVPATTDAAISLDDARRRLLTMKGWP